MRITNNMLTRSYLRNMNNNMSNLAKSNQKMASQRKFSKTSEDVTGASRALLVREKLSTNDRNLDTINEAKGRIAAIEDNMRDINGLLQTVNERTIQGMNGTMAQEEKNKIANEIKNIQNQIFQLSNAEYSGQYLFGAAGGPVAGAAPFTLVNGVLNYNGASVSTLDRQPDGSYNANGVPFGFNNENYIDIGLGFKVDTNGVLDTNTAIKSSVSGLDVFGSGETNGLPNNIFNLLGKIATDLENSNSPELGRDLNHLKVVTDNLLNGIADIGNRSTFIEQAEARIENEKLNNQTIQNRLEAVPLQEEAIYNKDFEMSWMVTLQLGSKILPTSIFDFLR